MADKPENHTLRLLQEMREENVRMHASTNASLKELSIAVAALSVDLKAFRAEVSGEQKKTGRRFNTLEERVTALEEHTGIFKA